MYQFRGAAATRGDDAGFTLVELLVVIVIIGVLSAIAVPTFLNQRKKAVDATLKADVRSLATAMETAIVDTQEYPTDPDSLGLTFSPGSVIGVGHDTATAGASGFCVAAYNARSSWTGDGSYGGSGIVWYDSLLGGQSTGARPVGGACWSADGSTWAQMDWAGMP